ncbi:MAG: hypothetical protein H6722_06565 [Sandaracinus sp.]|nr:hypothetical protein [Sandaracinus sp.]
MKATKLILAAGLAAGLGCSTASTTTTSSTQTPSVGGELAMAPMTVAEREAPEAELPRFEADALASLPQAPWSDAATSPSAAPVIAGAWASAENRGWCAPLAPTLAANARATQLDGGWMVEFDEAGAPGVSEDGELCESCGRGTFGIAGTAMGVDEMMEAPSPAFADGSAADVSSEDGVASATLAVPGQRCVYQVWSFRGESHLQELLGSLRFVSTPRTGDTQMADIYPVD